MQLLNVGHVDFFFLNFFRMNIVQETCRVGKIIWDQHVFLWLVSVENPAGWLATREIVGLLWAETGFRSKILIELNGWYYEYPKNSVIWPSQLVHDFVHQQNLTPPALIPPWSWTYIWTGSTFFTYEQDRPSLLGPLKSSILTWYCWWFRNLAITTWDV